MGTLWGTGESITCSLFCCVSYIAGLQIRGIEESTKLNTAMVVLKLAIIVFVIAVGAFYVDPANLSSFFPFGISGVLGGAALVFFAVSRDGLLPCWLVRSHSKFHTPYRSTIIVGLLTAVVAGLLTSKVWPN